MDFIANGLNPKTTNNEIQKSKHDDLWEEEADDDDEEEEVVKPPEPIKNTPIVINNQLNTQQVR